jgi:NAD-dependent SIR2 family protein deacetylase
MNRTSRSNISIHEKQHRKNISASLATLNCTDSGYLILEGQHGEQSPDLKGSLTHLKNPNMFVNTRFTIRFFENEQLVELTNCRTVEVDQEGILQFIVRKENSSFLKVNKNLETQTEVMFHQIQEMMSSRSYGHLVFVMGAGASIDVLPGGADLLRKMLQQDPHTDIRRFITDVFKADIKEEGVPFPSFNQVLNVIDIALEREEGFSAEYSLDILRSMKKEMIDELRKYMIDNANEDSENSYTQLAENLKEYYDNNGRISFITLNYDLYLDIALTKVFGVDSLEYCLPFQSLNNSGIDDEQTNGKRNKIHVIKLHGSLDWMICPTCFTAYKVSKAHLHMSLNRRTCNEDHTVLKEFLFPPTKERIEVHSHWTTLQGEADHLLRKADKVVFIGFSLSDDDAHFRFKLKKHLHRPENPVYIQVVGREKKEYDIASNAWNYWQYFGPVDYRPIGFKSFSNNPF